ncbi:MULTISPECIES: DUF3551 domain-containing protein [Bradyrhizobium]|nr:DUF3551 domain-containing protein [Bradyrhizobium sp. SEMIA]
METPQSVSVRHASGGRTGNLDDPFEEVAMRMLRWLILSSAMILVITSATAQTFDPRSPVCLQKWEWGGSTYFECAYTTWDQCRVAAIGLAAMCLENPYWRRPQPRLSGGRLRPSAPY